MRAKENPLRGQTRRVFFPVIGLANLNFTFRLAEGVKWFSLVSDYDATRHLQTGIRRARTIFGPLDRHTQRSEDEHEERHGYDHPDNPSERLRDGRWTGKFRDQPHHEADHDGDHQKRDEPSQQRAMPSRSENGR